MPYVSPWRRETLDPDVMPDNAGELNYVFTKAAIDYVTDHGLSYSTINDIQGAFEGAKAEFYRRVAVPYEDNKIAENGDVYPDELLTETT